MQSTVKRYCSLALICVMLVSVLVLPASASTVLSPKIAGQFAYFDMVYYNNAYSGYTLALQRFLQCYSTKYATILKRAEKNGNGGLDGVFGQCTYDAVTDYQGIKNLDPDGWVGPDTWGKIRDDLSENSYSGLRNLTVKGRDVIAVLMDGDTPTKFIAYIADGNASKIFHYYTVSTR